jgi:hypothetical protein
MSCKEHCEHKATAPAPDRRDTLLGLISGAGLLGLRSLATGLPAAFLMNPRAALAQTSADYKPTFLVMATSGSGDALNANTPGSYDDPTIKHPHDDEGNPLPGFEKADVDLGGTKVKGAAVWNTAPADFRSRALFFHHATLTANHGDEPRVLKLMGAVRRSEMLTSFIAKTLQPALGTIQRQPIVLSGEVLQFEGRYQPRLQPTGMKSVLASQTGVEQSLQKLRDSSLDKLNAALKGSRNTTAQRAYMDSLALSQAQVRKLSEDFATDLADIKDNNANASTITAALLIKMGVTPAIQLHFGFSGDNHIDDNWDDETGSHATTIGTNLATFYAQLAKHDLLDKVTLSVVNVFGRTLAPNKIGRDHNSAHNVGIIAGPAIKPGVVGGVLANKGALSIDPQSGGVASSGGITQTDSLASFGKTVARACGVDDATVDDEITQGQWVRGAFNKG